VLSASDNPSLKLKMFAKGMSLMGLRDDMVAMAHQSKNGYLLNEQSLL